MEVNTRLFGEITIDDEKIIDNVIKNTEAKFVQAEEEVDNKEVEEDVVIKDDTEKKD